MNDQLMLAWAAGFIDGEGSILFTRRSGRTRDFSMKLQAVNTNIKSLERLKDLFGGSIHSLHNEKKAYGKNWKPSWIWSCSHRKAEETIRALLPFLLIKREQADLALLTRNYVGVKFRRKSAETQELLAELMGQMHTLNKKGR